ncbi:hypothetical protein BMS3Bbin08_00082 [bacterium BMS3Bbin08]|nr:hypothetical protein BMS3Bbin08_00082 [bacterium BMS3Bbin08]HDZ02003.1 hypothetical protein [Nitrospirota bacterium]
MVTRRDYTSESVEAARSVLIELVHLLGEYKDDIVLIGGWIPEVLLPHSSGPHVGGGYCSLKGIDILVRPIRHRTVERVKSHIFI